MLFFNKKCYNYIMFNKNKHKKILLKFWRMAEVFLEKEA